MRDSVIVSMAAPIEEVWDLVSDVTRIGEFSPETFEAEWMGDATGPEVGARFRGHVKRNQKGPTYWSPCVVDVCDPPADGHAEFTFTVVAGGRRVNTWGYELESVEAGTEVTEFFRLTPSLPMRVYWTLLGWTRGKTNRRGMTETLNRMKAVVEA